MPEAETAEQKEERIKKELVQQCKDVQEAEKKMMNALETSANNPTSEGNRALVQKSIENFDQKYAGLRKMMTDIKKSAGNEPMSQLMSLIELNLMLRKQDRKGSALDWLFDTNATAAQRAEMWQYRSNQLKEKYWNTKEKWDGSLVKRAGGSLMILGWDVTKGAAWLSQEAATKAAKAAESGYKSTASGMQGLSNFVEKELEKMKPTPKAQLASKKEPQEVEMQTFRSK